MMRLATTTETMMVTIALTGMLIVMASMLMAAVVVIMRPMTTEHINAILMLSIDSMYQQLKDITSAWRR